MKILMIADVFYPDTVGGAGRYLYDLSCELSRRGHDICILTREKSGKPKVEQFESFQIYRFTIPETIAVRDFMRGIRHQREILHTILTTNKFDQIIIHQPFAALGCLLMRIKLPIIYVFHSPWAEEYRIKHRSQAGVFKRLVTQNISTLMAQLERRLLRKATRVITLSRYMKEIAMRTHAISRDRITVIPGGVDVNRFSLVTSKTDARRRCNLNTKGHIIFTLRNLVPRMGLDNLISAIRLLKTDFPKMKVLIGGSGPLRKELNDQIERYQLRKWVSLMGEIPDDALPLYYRAATCFVLPTAELEGFGLVSIEAMACGTPVLATPVGGSVEILERITPQNIFSSTSATAIANGIRRFFDKHRRVGDKVQAKELRQHILNYYHWRVIGEEWHEILSATNVGDNARQT